MSVVDLARYKEENSPHLSGNAKCLACGHKWVAVAPVSVIWMECPECTLERGRYVAQAQQNGEHWHCKCGCDLFYATPDGFYCPNCGVEQVF